MATVLGSRSLNGLKVCGPVDLGLGGNAQHTKFGFPAPNQVYRGALIIAAEGLVPYPEVNMGKQGAVSAIGLTQLAISGTDAQPCYVYIVGDEYLEAAHNRYILPNGDTNRVATGGNLFLEGTKNGLLPTPPYYSSMTASQQTAAGESLASYQQNQILGNYNALQGETTALTPNPPTQLFTLAEFTFDPANNCVYPNQPNMQDYWFTNQVSPGLQASAYTGARTTLNTQNALALLTRPTMWLGDADPSDALAGWGAAAVAMYIGGGGGGVALDGASDSQGVTMRQIVLPDPAFQDQPALNLQEAIETLLGPASNGASAFPGQTLNDSPTALRWGDYVSVDFTMNLECNPSMSPADPAPTAGAETDILPSGRGGFSPQSAGWSRCVLNTPNWILVGGDRLTLMPFVAPGGATTPTSGWQGRILGCTNGAAGVGGGGGVVPTLASTSVQQFGPVPASGAYAPTMPPGAPPNDGGSGGADAATAVIAPLTPADYAANATPVSLGGDGVGGLGGPPSARVYVSFRLTTMIGDRNASTISGGGPMFSITQTSASEGCVAQV